MTRHDQPYIAQYYDRDGNERSKVLTLKELEQEESAEREEAETATGTPERGELHQAASRRQSIQAVEKFFSPVVVPNGSQQSSAIKVIRERSRLLALAIEDYVPDGDQKLVARQKCAESMFWSVQAISHR